jgi:translation initiation factor 5B
MAEQEKTIRAPIITVLGHIDHGKTSLLDYIRGTIVQKKEASGITQHIGASYFPMEKILDFCKAPKALAEKITIPGLLIIDTPGHTAFMNLRKRGGAVADAAILVIEMPTGPMQTTWESVRILRGRKVPFIIAANKIDRINGWRPNKNADFLETYKKQDEWTRQLLDESVLETVGLFYEEGFEGIDRYDKIKDFTKKIAIIPTSAVTGEGIPSLLLVLVGIVNQYLQHRIQFTDGPGEGVVLEVKKEKGYGRTIDVILFNGHFKKGQTIVIGGSKGPVETHIRALLTPKDLDEIRDPSDSFKSNDIIHAASGVKILAPNLDDVIAGGPIYAVGDEQDPQEIIEKVQSELQTIAIETDDEGIILKADTLGSLEAAVGLFKESNIPVRKASVGMITKQDVMDAAAVREIDEINGVICGFNVKTMEGIEKVALDNNIRVFTNPVIYQVVDEFLEYREKRENEEVAEAMEELTMPCKLQILNQYIFRRSNPFICGVSVEGGILVPKMPVINNQGKVVGRIHSITKNNKPIQKAVKGDEVAISIKGATLGRNIQDDDVLYIKAPEGHIRQLRTRFRHDISPDTLDALIEYVKIMREHESSYWAA